MRISISSTKTIAEIQEAFTLHYPFLKIEFFGHPHSFLEGSPKRDRLSSGKNMSDAGAIRLPATIEIPTGQTAGGLEQAFERSFGLHIQVYRLQRNKWIQTAGTDGLTLWEQNEIGRNTSLGTDLDAHTADFLEEVF